MEGHFIIFCVVQDLEHDLKHVLQLLALGGGDKQYSCFASLNPERFIKVHGLMLRFGGSRWHLDLHVLCHEVCQYLRLDHAMVYESDIVHGQLDGPPHDLSHGVPVVQDDAYG